MGLTDDSDAVTFVMAMQLLFPLIGIGYLLGAWRRRADVVDDVFAGVPVRYVPAGRRKAFDRCQRTHRPVTRTARRSRMAFERSTARQR